MRTLVLSSALGLGLLCARPAAAAEPVNCDDALLHTEAHRARVWRYSWMGVHGALTIGSFVAVPLVAKEERPDYVIGGIGEAVNFATTWLMPLRVESAADELEALPPGERGKHVRRLVLESAEDEQSRVTWPWHLINFGLSAVPGAIIAFGYGHYESGLITTVAGTVIGSVQIFTQPTRLPTSCAPAALTLVPRLTLLRAPDWSTHGAALSLTGTF